MHCVSEDDFELQILSPLPPKYWVCRCAPPSLAYEVQGITPKSFVHARQALPTELPGPLLSAS